MILLGTYCTTALAHTNTGVIEKKHSQQPTMNPYIDELDQFMTTAGGVLPVGAVTTGPGTHTNLSVAQSFIPQKAVLTRIQFLMAKNITTTYPCSLAIKDNITGVDLTSIRLDPEQFPVADNAHPENLTWIDFNFTDIWVIPGQTYYMVISTANITNNFYYVTGNGSNLYPNGTAYWSLDNGNTWAPIPPGDADGCFKTYGLRETTLAITPGGGLYTSFIITNTGNVTAWDINASLGVQGGLIFLGSRVTSFYIPELDPGNSVTVKTILIFGLGKIQMTLTVKAANVREQAKTINAFLLFFFVVGIH